jgi:PAS domain S-box-containing protein
MTARWKHSIRAKLTGIIMLISTTAVLMACAFLVAQDVVDERAELNEQLRAYGQLIGAHSEATLKFDDPKAAMEELSVLRAKASFVAGAVYTDKGVLFASYANGTSAPPRLLHSPDGIIHRPGGVELFLPITLDGERVGTVYLASDLRNLKARMVEDAQFVVVILLVCLTVVFILTSRLQRRISDPIVELARVARNVSKDKDYSVRATKHLLHPSHEIDNLVAGFNGMLAEIEQRDDRLLLIQTHLEKTVACRTEELTIANEELLGAKNAAERIAEVNEQMARESALILNSATDGIIGVDLDTEPSFLNPAGARMLGRSLDNLRGVSIHDLIHHSRADGTPWPEGDCPLGQALLRGESLSVIDDTFWRSDGTSFPVEYSATPMFDEQGNKRGAVVTFRDVTERRAIERLKSEFVSTVSHELRTPLTSIRGALGLLGSGLLGPMAEKGQRMLEIAVSNTDRLVRLINDILDLERIGSGKVELARGPVDAHTVMIQAVQGLQSMADQAGVHLIITPASETLWGDSDRIIQTLTNLIGNAIKFSLPETTVTVSGTARTGDFAFCIADQGRGIPEEKLVTIFERFSQVDASDSRDKGGTGLGLAICQTIVTAHGGRIWAEKNDPSGSRFQFTIPLAAPAIIALQTTEGKGDSEVSPPSDLAGSAPAILVVEDDLDLARVMTTSLQSRGIRTIHAVTGSEAVRLCHKHEPSLIVLDIGLPDMDGYAVVRALRESTTLRSLPLIVYSALDVDRSDQARLRLGPTEFLTKSRCSLPDFESHVVRLLEIVTSRKTDRQHAA